MSKKRPFGITILSVIGFISAFIVIGFGALFLVIGGNALQSLDGVNLGIIANFANYVGILFIISGLIEGAISFGLWKMKKWAWYVAIGTYALSTIYALTQMNFVSLIIGGLMVYYLYRVRKKF